MATGQSSSGMTAVEEFITKVRNAIVHKGWTIKQLAQEAGVGRPYLHRILSGEQEPSMKKAAQIGKPLGLTVRTIASRKKSQK